MHSIVRANCISLCKQNYKPHCIIPQAQFLGVYSGLNKLGIWLTS